MKHFKKINLNLLTHLHALLTEKNVSAAAEKAFVSQPAMSASLKQLRAIFDDPLLVAAKGQMVLSTKAQELQPHLQQIMSQVQNLLQPQEEFDPMVAKRTFKIALPDYVELILLPSLLKSLEKFPHIVIETRITGIVDRPSLFLDKTTDIAIGALEKENVPSQLIARKLYEEKIICFASKKNPLLKQPISLKNYLASKHIAFSFDEKRFSHSADFLSKRKLKRNDILFVNNILPALFAVADSSSVIATAPSFLINMFAGEFGLVQQPLPFDLEPTPIYLVIHQKDHSDKGIQWLSQLLSESIGQLEADFS
ncbi:transcriptional regulator [Legionella lansingensis]|uniref:LysR transcriptional regulator n=1 Tax=Legionella lansingensis TaxID=45067 RepID=A0A0W0VS77_9GAMM|nr:LysR family transcriptional regulator [Legionella lansingensis]KTD22665.1 LysR transcriptional regulator [Legionella lansingensis]SNV55761.1 transcriptional regulator [Legionella lansingensis]